MTLSVAFLFLEIFACLQKTLSGCLNQNTLVRKFPSYLFNSLYHLKISLCVFVKSQHPVLGYFAGLQAQSSSTMQF